MRLLDNILALMPCGKPQATFMAYLLALLQWLPGRLNFTGLEAHGGRAARTHARWFGRPFPFARLAVGTLAAVHPRVSKGLGELLVVDTSFVAKNGRKTWGVGWFWSGMARAVRWGLEVSLLAAVDVDEGGAYPLCARQSPAAGRARGKAPDGETAAEMGLALLREALAAGAGELLGTRWVAADGGYSSRTFVEGVRALGLHTVGRLRRDAVLRYRYTGPHERRPGRRRQFDGRFDPRDPARLTHTPLDDASVDLYHGELHGKAWQRWLQVVYVLPRGADPQTTRGVLLYSSDTELDPVRLFHFYRARFQIEFAFRDAKQHLGLQDCRARAQAKLDFHFNIVFAALFWARLQARLRTDAPLGPFSLQQIKQGNFEAEIHKRFAARSARGRHAANAEGMRSRRPQPRLWRPPPPLKTEPTGP